MVARNKGSTARKARNPLFGLIVCLVHQLVGFVGVLFPKTSNYLALAHAGPSNGPPSATFTPPVESTDVANSATSVTGRNSTAIDYMHAGAGSLSDSQEHKEGSSRFGGAERCTGRHYATMRSGTLDRHGTRRRHGTLLEHTNTGHADVVAIGARGRPATETIS